MVHSRWTGRHVGRIDTAAGVWRIVSVEVDRGRVMVVAGGVDHSRVTGSHRCGVPSVGLRRSDSRLNIVEAGNVAAVAIEAVVGNLLADCWVLS